MPYCFVSPHWLCQNQIFTIYKSKFSRFFGRWKKTESDLVRIIVIIIFLASLNTEVATKSTKPVSLCNYYYPTSTSKAIWISLLNKLVESIATLVPILGKDLSYVKSHQLKSCILVLIIHFSNFYTTILLIYNSTFTPKR